MDKLHWAQWFINHGFAIFPVEPQSKRAVVKEWKRFCREPLTDEEKERYIKMISNGYNYAVPGGQKNLVILDFEDRELLKAWIGDELDKLCRNTLCVNTVHGGIHVYVITDELPDHKFNPLFVKENKGIADLQSYNSYVVGPGSCINHVHCESDKCTRKGQDDTACYTPYNNNEIGKVDLRGLLAFLAERGKGLGIELSKSAMDWIGKTKAKPEDLEKIAKEMGKYDQFKGKTVEAVREELCNVLKSELANTESEKARQTLGLAYTIVCEGKRYTDVNVKKAKGEGADRSRIDWAVLNVLLSHGVTNLSTLLKLIPEDSKIFDKWGEQYLTLTLRKAWKNAKPVLEYRIKTQGKNDREAKKIAKAIITDSIMKRYKITTFYRNTGHNQAILGVFVWSRKRGAFVPFDKGLRKTIRETAELLEIRSQKTIATLSKRDVDDVYDEVKDLTLTELPEDPLRIAFKNGTLEWTVNGAKWYDVKERTPKEYAFYYLPWEVRFEELEKFATKEITVEDVEQLARRLCPKSLEAFKTWVDEKWITLFEIAGYTFYPEIKFRKAFMLVGEGKNAKSTFINTIKELLGEYAEDISPRELFDSQNRFIVSDLYHKLANAVAESKDFTIDDMDRFKRLTGGDWFTADVKFKDPITFKNIAKLIVASNNMPRLRDNNDKAFWHRWLIVEFPHQFVDDDTWFRRTFTNEELNGMVTVSLLAFMRVIQHRRFDYEQDEKQVMDIWLSKTDSVYAFVSGSIKEGIITLDPKNGDLWATRADLYKLYRNYCADQGFTGAGRKSFARKLREYFGVTTVMKNVNGKRVRAFVGIAIDELVKEHLAQEYDDAHVDSFFNYVKQFNGAVKEYWEIVQDFGGDKAKANKFLVWCERRRFCYQRGLDMWEIRTW
jgi:putative DNA primase/helicase